MGSDYVVSRVLFDSTGAVRTDRPLEAQKQAISFLTWVAKGREDTIPQDAKRKNAAAKPVQETL